MKLQVSPNHNLQTSINTHENVAEDFMQEIYHTANKSVLEANESPPNPETPSLKTNQIPSQNHFEEIQDSTYPTLLPPTSPPPAEELLPNDSLTMTINTNDRITNYLEDKYNECFDNNPSTSPIPYA